MKKDNTIIPIGIRLLGFIGMCIFLLFIIFNIITFRNILLFFDATLGYIASILILLLITTVIYGFDDNNFIMTSIIKSVKLPYYRITEIRYIFAGFVMLCNSNSVQMMIFLLCSKKATRKRLQSFINCLKEKNSLLITNL